MIEYINGCYHITTKDIGYAFRVTKHGDLQHIYYGSKVSGEDLNALIRQRELLLVNTLYTDGDEAYGIDDMDFEYSFSFRGDSRSCAANMATHGQSVFDFVFDAAQIDERLPHSCMPIPKGYNNSLCITLKDSLHSGLKLELWYLSYYNCNVVARFVRIVNHSGQEIVINKLMSAQYDLRLNAPRIISFCGAWGRERRQKEQVVKAGKIQLGSYSGMSSAECNPFFMLKGENASTDYGDVYGFNLIYSASHEIGAEITSYGGVRITHGVQSEGFSYRLEDKQEFISPLSISTYSDCGLNGVSVNMQKFVRELVSPKIEVPIMLNSWEAMYFDLDCDKLKLLADKAYELGFDGIVIDDGWFADRNDDSSSLGDWYENRRKFPNGIAEIADYLKAKDMKLGIWIEPEMISEKSELFVKHPQWVLMHTQARQIVGRNQYILDLSQSEVQDYLYNVLVRIITQYGADYIKWDFNRRFSDVFGGEGGGYHYRYIKGLYGLLKRITDTYPHVIIENCASGGGRFDLGMLSYSPMGWVSDNTDPLSRAEIQDGTSYGYPISVMLNHITAELSHQTRRRTSFKSRNDTAYIGVLGAQWDITKIEEQDKQRLADAVTQYKSERKILIGSTLTHIPTSENTVAWQIMSEDNNLGWVYMMLKRFYTVSEMPILKLSNLDGKARYRIYGDNLEIVLSGAALMNVGLVLPQNYQGVNTSDKLLNLTDFSTLLLRIQKIREDR